MPGPCLHVGAQVLCQHGGTAQPTVPNPRVTVSGQPTVTIAAPYAVAGCALSASGTPCVTAQWLSGSVRVTALGQPLVIVGGQSVSTPNGTPLLPVVFQTRVLAT
jgi:hypothetical protein